MGKNILLIENFAPLAAQMKEALEKEIGIVSCASDNEEALQLIKSKKFDAIILNSKLPDASGLAFVKKLIFDSPNAGTLIVTTADDFAPLHEVNKGNAGEWITKPFYPDEFLAKTKKILLTAELQQETARLRRENERLSSFGPIIGATRAMAEVYKMIGSVADADATVIIYGETGTGKELVARTIHGCGRRRSGRFVGISCGALPESLLESELFGHERGAFTSAVRQKHGLVETAHGGTLFLDEIADISIAMQVKLLRFLQEREFTRVGGNEAVKVDVRVMAATNKNLCLEISRGKFRQDLYYRLNVVPISLPPLREHIEDLPLLVRHFLQKHSLKSGKKMAAFSPSAMQHLLSYHWPGNVRQLENIIERALILADGALISEAKILDILQPAPTPASAHPSSADLNVPFKMAKRRAVELFEKNYLRCLLKESRGNLTKASKKSGIAVKTLMRKMAKYGWKRKSFKEARGGTELNFPSLNVDP